MANRVVRYILLVVVVILLWLIWPLQRQIYQQGSNIAPHNDDENKVHPIERLFEEARLKQALTLRRQSQNLEEARTEYRRRYEIPPPEGFDAWYDYAKSHRSPIIDDFDEMMISLRPFRAYQTSKCEFQHAWPHSHPALMTVCVKNGSIEFRNPNLSPYDTKQIVKPLLDFTSDFVDRIPDMCFYLNTYDEPRQVIPITTQLEMASQTSLDTCEDHSFDQSKRKNVWEKVIASCPERSPALTGADPQPQPYAPLVSDWNAATDLCDNTESPHSGILRCPDTSSLTSGTRPILSAAKLSTFSDILFPTLWRWRFNIDSPRSIVWAKLDDDISWTDKKPALGWRGSSTGGHANGENWRKFQRHQMVALANDSSSLTSALSVRNPAQMMERLDIHFTSITGCEDATCEVMKAELPTQPSQTLAETFQNKIVLDMDGHGLSGRLYMLLQSHSAVMKQGLLREWHDSRLLPWLHYIPLSMEMAELEEVLEFFFGTERGDQVLHAIAEEGRTWVRESLRREDMRVYMYRLLLEMARKTF